ncbi:MAG: hypothetical protein WBF38_05610 [Nitrosotalea sp.]
MNFSKRTLLFILVLSFSGVLLISYAHAQTLSFVSTNANNPNSTLSFNGFSNQTTTDPRTAFYSIPYHPRDPSSFWAEKQHLDSAAQNSTSIQSGASISHISHTAFVPSVTTYPGFNGIDVTAGGGFDPPDVAFAAGPSYVMELVNIKGEIWNKQGVSQQNLTLSSFFGLASSDYDFLKNPKLLYDNSTSRWFASILDTRNATVAIAISQSSNPTGSWYTIRDSFSTACPDQPRLGINDDKVVIAANIFACPNSFLRSEYHVYSKTSLESGTKTMQNFTANDFGIMPVQSQSSTTTLYMVSDGGDSSTSSILLYSLTGTVPSVSSSTSTVSVHTINTAADAVQVITGTTLDTGDTRPLDAAWYKGNLWFALDDGCKPTGETTTRSCIRAIELNTNTTKRIQDFDINKTDTYYYYPALRFDGFGGMGTIFGISNSTVYPSLIVTGQSIYDPANSTKQLSYLKAGSEYENNPPPLSEITPYGKYFGAGLDPSNKTKVWVAGEYNTEPPGHTAPTWSTFIGSESFNCVPPSSGDWTVTSSCTLGASSTAPANVIVDNGAVLTIPNAETLSLDFTHYHLYVSPGGGVYIAPGGKIS